VPLARRQALCIGIMSYDGSIDFGLVGDYDGMAELDSFGLDLEAAIAEIVETAPAPSKGARTSRTRTRNGAVPVN
jgi:hypothetical protein